MSPPTQCDNYCLVPQLSPLLGFYALCYSGQGEGLTYKTLYFLKEPINTWSSDPSFFMPWHHLPSTSCHEPSHVSAHVWGTDQDRYPAFSYFHGKLLPVEALPKFPSALLLSQFGNTLCLPAKTREFQTRTSLHSITNIPTAYL